MRKLLLVVFAVLLLFLFVSGVSADTVFLYYADGNFADLPAGTYSSVERVDNVWYVNGAVYPPSGGSGVVAPDDVSPTVSPLPTGSVGVGDGSVSLVNVGILVVIAVCAVIAGWVFSSKK